MAPELSFVMAESRKKKCRLCGLADGHTLINCPNRCGFCGDSITRCLCQDSSLVRGVMDSETPKKKSVNKMPSTSKRNAEPGDLDEW